MQEDNVVKAYARSNFSLNKSTSLPATTQSLPNLANNASACHQFSNNYQQSDALEYNPFRVASDGSLDEEYEEEQVSQQQAEQNENSDERINSSSASAGTKKRRKRMQGHQMPSETSSKHHGRNQGRKINSSQINGYHMSNVAPLSREERKNEQIIRMIERQEKLRIRKEQKKQGIQISRSREGRCSSESSCSVENQGVLNGAARNSRAPVSQSRVNATNKQASSSLGNGSVKAQVGGNLKSQKQKQAVEITVVFSDHYLKQNTRTRFFYDRKRTIEDRQRQEFNDPWMPQQAQDVQQMMQHCIMPGQEQSDYNLRHFQHQNYYSQNLNMHVHAGTGGHYDPGWYDADPSKSSVSSSYLSNCKRQRIDGHAVFNPSVPHQLISLSVPTATRQNLPLGNQASTLGCAPHFRSVSEECNSVENLENAAETFQRQEILERHPLEVEVNDQKHKKDQSINPEAQLLKDLHYQKSGQEFQQAKLGQELLNQLSGNGESDSEEREIRKIIELTRKRQRESVGEIFLLRSAPNNTHAARLEGRASLPN